MHSASLDDNPPDEVLPGTHLSQLAAGDAMSIQHFRIEAGTVVEIHRHHHEQAGYLIHGTLQFKIDDIDYHIGPKGSYVIPANQPHRAENTGDVPAIGVEIFSPPRPTPPWIDD